MRFVIPLLSVLLLAGAAPAEEPAQSAAPEQERAQSEAPASAEALAALELLLEAALAAARPEAAAGVAAWVERTGIEDRTIRALTARIGEIGQ